MPPPSAESSSHKFVPQAPASSSVYKGPPPSVITAPSAASVHPSGGFIPKPVKAI